MGCHPCKHKVLVNNDNFICYLCLQNYPEYMHYPCGHYGLCEGCRLTLREENNIYRKKCPVCNQKGSIKKIFFQGDEDSIRRTVTDYCIHLERKKNEKLEGDNKILKEISVITNQKSEIISQENKRLTKENVYYKKISENNNQKLKRLTKENEYYKKLSENNGQKLKNIIIGYKNYTENLNLKKILNVKKMEILSTQKEIKDKNYKKDMYIISLIQKYQGKNIVINEIDDYIEKYLQNNNNSNNKEFHNLEELNSII